MSEMINLKLPWVEKYRPKVLKDVIGQETITSRLQSYVKTRDLPNLMFAGHAGIGKTSAAVALARELFGEEYSRNFLELNASVTGDTPVLVRMNGKIKRTNFAELDKQYFHGDEKYSTPVKLETLSIDENNIVCFMPVSLISKHRVSEIETIDFEGGKIKTSLNHSVIVLDSYGNLISKECRDLTVGDVLLTFHQETNEKQIELDFNQFPVQLANQLRSGLIQNPKVSVCLNQIKLDEDLSWLFGLYLAEGCTGMRKGCNVDTSGNTIFTLAYPQEQYVADRVSNIVKNKFGLRTRYVLGKSGFDRSKKSSIQVQVLNTQLAKFFRKEFYSEGERKYARTKRVPGFIFESPIPHRIAFLKGYMGDATGKWGEYVRYSSRSKENLIDIAWLAQTCGLRATVFDKEIRLVWRVPNYKQDNTNLLPAEPFITAFKREGIECTHFFRHSLYGKKSKRIAQSKLVEFFDKMPFEKRVRLGKLEQIVRSGITCTIIKKITKTPYSEYVYDFSVPKSEKFYGGTTPVLLHNSDDRGIDVVRSTIKEFARTLAFNADFKIIFLDESDALTADAQQALRRTMEKYSKTCRFVLSCNYSSRIIEPIQSRCVVFRFRPLRKIDLETMIHKIAKEEKLTVEPKAIDAIEYVAEGDLRKAVNVLQASAALEKKITEDVVYSVANRAKPKEVKEMIQLALKGKFMDAREKLDYLMLENGLSGEDVIKQIHREVLDWDEKELDSTTKIRLVDRIGEYDFRLVEGANERIQIEALLAQIGLVASEKK
ncbi:MAG: replication factor C small subunit [Candidatus Diapherotrites archaeon]